MHMPQSPLRPNQMPRSQTSPVLSTDIRGKQMSPEQQIPSIEPLRISTAKDPDQSAVEEICLSPSWSDHGERRRKRDKKKAEKDQKDQTEREKRTKHEEEKRKTSELKAVKRLSKKPPPAAMDTQKMPSALMRNSWISVISSHTVSGENTGRSSREERRPSLISLGSIRSNRRSQSTPPTNVDDSSQSSENSENWRPIVSPSAPKLPSFRWSSRKTPPATGKSDFMESDDAYERDLITFAYRLEASTFTSESDYTRSKQSSRIGTPQQQPDTSCNSRSCTAPNLHSTIHQFKPAPSTPKSPTKKTVLSGGNASSGGGDFGGGQQNSQSDLRDGTRGVVRMTGDGSRSSSRHPPSPRSAPLPQTRSSHDGSSYVHKQRMYQQQLSIAGFEEQQAMKDANDLANEVATEYEALLAERPSSVVLDRGRTSSPRRVDDLGITQPADIKKVRIDASSISPVSPRQRQRSNSPLTDSILSKYPSRGPTPLSQETKQTDGTEKEDEEAMLRQTKRDASLGKPYAPTGFKRDRILGFRRRMKEPPAFISVPYNTENQVVAIQSAPPDVPQSVEPPEKRSKIERIFGEPRPSFAEPEGWKRSSSLVRSQPEGKAANSKSSQSHSRTRTSSSTVLNDNTLLPKPIIKSQTEPVLTPKTKSAKSAMFNKDNAHDLSDGKPKGGINAEPSVGMLSRPEDTGKDLKRELNGVDDRKVQGTPEDAAEFATNTLVETKRPKKALAEVVVQSETGDGLVRKASLTRPRSNPQLQSQTTTTNSLPSLDFLPRLKHQPLVKKERQSPTRPTQADTTAISMSHFPPIAPLSYHSPASAYPPDLKLIPRSPRRPPSQFPLPAGSRHNRSATDVGTLSSFGQGALAEGWDAKPVAKLFVICCKCKFWHDLPSKLYEAMALPKELHKAEDGKLTGARLETAVRCPWCEHAMTTFCCQGWTTVVYLHERHH